VTIRLLADTPESVEPLARAFFAEWPDAPAHRTLDSVVARFEECRRRDGLPLALVALEDRRPIGTVALRADSISTRPELGPWLAALWVAPERRGFGLGTRLVRAAEAQARRLGIPTVHAGTGTSVSLFERLGWRVEERIPYHGGRLAILRWDAVPAAPPETRPRRSGAADFGGAS
jgi:GNAT superfamily N-acetyltransferase